MSWNNNKETGNIFWTF